MRHHAIQDSTKHGAPIAQVLNDTETTQDVVNASPASYAPQAAPFSGKLADLLLETPDRLQPNERRRTDYQHDDSSRTAGENPVFKLPQLPQLPTKTTERARIPPLLQGLHQPPPLPPSGRLFPPITDGASGFEQDIRDRIQSANQSQEARAKTSQDVAPIRPDDLNDSNDIDGEHDREDQDDLLSAKPPHIHDQDPTSPEVNKSASPTIVEKQKGKKRRRWSDDETRDLLLGVSRFGIGKWKRILQCSDYTFHGRTAVDLKDRFRVCCPTKGSKLKRPKRQNDETDGATTSPRATAAQAGADVEKLTMEGLSNESLVQKDNSVEDADNEPPTKHPKLIELGIHTPFAKSTRRPRCGFTSRDDENLRKGFEKYGAAWHVMRDDRELGFGTRHPTDLRDRFRIRYAEAYAQAGYKAKVKVKTRRIENQDSNKQSDTSMPPQGPDQTFSDPKKRRLHEDAATDMNVSEVTERNLMPTSSTKQQLPHTYYPTDPGPFALGDMSSAMPQDKDGTFSPIVLNRNILQWADANNFLMTNTNTTSTVSYTSNHVLDMSMHITYPNDGMHIDPMATLKLPLMAITGPNNIPSGSSHNANSNSNSIPSNARTSYPSETLLAPNPWLSSSKTASSDDLLRTPNLPTIVFPHVPAASARGAVHNLPTPADLLSGMGHGVEGEGEGEFGSWGNT